MILTIMHIENLNSLKGNNMANPKDIIGPALAPFKEAGSAVKKAVQTGYSTVKSDINSLTRKDMPKSNAGETLYNEANRRAKKLVGEK